MHRNIHRSELNWNSTVIIIILALKIIIIIIIITATQKLNKAELAQRATFHIIAAKGYDFFTAQRLHNTCLKVHLAAKNRPTKMNEYEQWQQTYSLRTIAMTVCWWAYMMSSCNDIASQLTIERSTRVMQTAVLWSGGSKLKLFLRTGPHLLYCFNTGIRCERQYPLVTESRLRNWGRMANIWGLCPSTQRHRPWVWNNGVVKTCLTLKCQHSTLKLINRAGRLWEFLK